VRYNRLEKSFVHDLNFVLNLFLAFIIHNQTKSIIMPSKLTVRLWLTTCLLLFATIAFAQTTVTGKVTSGTDSQPVSGATVSVKGTRVATQTDENGSFSIAVPTGSSVLVITFIGFQTSEIALNGRTNIAVTLTEGSNSLNEVVVTGYSGQRRKDIVGAVATVKGEQLQAVQSGNPEQQLQGRVPGLTVITSGQPGTTSQVRIRGFGSFNGNNPLYIVDGVQVLGGIDFLNANDIETTTVLKDASSASVYGARASAGVILITTKKGKQGGKLNVTYDMSYGVTVPGKGLDLLSPQQQADWTWLALRAAGQIDTLTGNPTHPQYGKGVNAVLPDYIKVGGESGLSGLAANDPRLNPALYNLNFDKGPVYQVMKANKAGTDWYDALTDPRPIQNHTLALGGGSDNAKYYASFSFYDEHGPVINTYVKKIGMHLSTEFKVKDFIRFGENLSITYRENPNLGGPAGENDILFALSINPLIPVYDEGGGFAGTTAAGFNNSTQPVARRIRSKDNRGFGNIIFGNVFGEVDIMKDLTFRTTFGGGVGQFQGRFINYRTYENSENVGNTTFGEFAGMGAIYTWTNTLKYSHTFGNHQINAIGGIEAVGYGYGRNINGQGLNPFNNNFNFTTIDNTDPAGRAVSSDGSPWIKLFSQFVKLDYSFNDKFLFTGTVRRDGASNFSKTEQYGYFPALSAGWRITQEQFMKSVTWIDELKIRGGWGQMGNSATPPTNLINGVGGGPGSTAYDLTGANTSTIPGLAYSNVGNPFAKWETNTTINIGFDGTFLNKKLDIIFDWYTRKTKDLLYNPELPATLGTAAPPYVNVGSMKNTGVDMMFTYKDKISRDFRFEADLIFTAYKNEITKVSDIADNFDVQFSNRIGDGVVRNVVGQPVSTFFGYQVIGLFQNAADVTASPTQDGAAPGRFKYADIDGDKKITTSDRTYIGNPNPDFTYGLNARLFYKDFDFEALFYGVSGGEVLNFTKWFLDFYPSFAGIGKSSRVLNSWTPTNTNTDVPRFENVSNFSTNGNMNSYYIEKGSYFRLRSIKIGYTVPASVLNRVKMNKIHFFVQGTNLFTATKYTGTDPEVSGVDTNFGVDVGNYPVNKQFLVGVNIGL
jgi:TonB-dependent starch-binding outer membrane protein SusC